MPTIDLDRLEKWKEKDEIIFAKWLEELDSSNDDIFELPEDIDFYEGHMRIPENPLEDILPLSPSV